jgi:hypothetical protein
VGRLFLKEALNAHKDGMIYTQMFGHLLAVLKLD